MTPNAPSFDQLEKFLKADGWKEVTGQAGSGSGHRVFEKVLDDRDPVEVLTTHISHSGTKSPGPGRFGEILREQLNVSKQAFWKAIETGEPVPRPQPVEESPPAPEAWQVEVLVHQVGLTPNDLKGMTLEAAQALIEKHWTGG